MTSDADNNQSEDWMLFMKDGNKLFRSGNYVSAEERYLRSVELLTSLVGETTVHEDNLKSCFAKRYGNCAECCMRRQDFRKSLEYAKKCVNYRQDWYKAHLRVGRAYRKLGKLKKSLVALVNTFNSTLPLQDDEIRQKVLYELVETTMFIEDNNSQNYLKDLQNISSSFWAQTVCFYIQYQEWKIAEHIVKNFWNIPLVKEPQGNLSFQAVLENFNDQNILRSGAHHKTSQCCLDLLRYVIDNLVVPSKEQNIPDKNGDTVLHMLAKLEESETEIESEVLKEILDKGVNHMIQNSDGKLALELCNKQSFTTHVRGKVIPKELLIISADNCRAVLRTMIECGKWDPAFELVQEFRKVKGGRALSNFAAPIKLSDAITNNSHQREESDKVKLVSFLIEEGAIIDDCDALKTSIKQQEWKLTLELIKLGVNPNGVVYYPGDTPYHAALKLALEKQSGDLTLLLELKRISENQENQCFKHNIHCQDKEGNNLLHLAAQAECNESSLKAVKLLSDWGISSEVKNLCGNIPSKYLLDWDDERTAYLKKPKRKKSTKTKTDLRNSHELPLDCAPTKSNNLKDSPSKDPKTIAQGCLKKMPDAIGFLNPVKSEECVKKSSNDVHDEENSTTIDGLQSKIKNIDLQEIMKFETEKTPATDFDELVWEIECTESVWNLLKALKTQDARSILKEKKLDKDAIDSFIKIILMKIKQLGTGNWSNLNQTQMKGVDSSLNLVMLPLPMETCILWELAVAFSHRSSEARDSSSSMSPLELTHLEEGIIYSQQIRIWEIVLEMSDLELAVQKINQSHSRGKKCIIQKILECKSEKSNFTRLKLNGDGNIPGYFTKSNDSGRKTLKCFPPATRHENEFNILKLYTFSSCMVSAILSDAVSKIDFPFKVAEIEHQFITLKSDAPFLLLGRSGTGKTTCCLYRLFKEFVNYWTEADKAGRPLKQKDLQMIEDATKEEEFNVQITPTAIVSGEDEEEENEENEYYEHLHQLFVTKNPVLCAEVEKNFIRLCQTSASLQQRVQKREKFAHCLEDTLEESYPLFLTSKQLLLMLDASVSGSPFFPRDENLKPLHYVPGWEEQEDVFFDLGHPILGNQNPNNGAVGDHRPLFKKPEKQRTDFKTECTYVVFEQVMWPKLKKEFKDPCHPSLVWTEIVSFIKGSHEALETEQGFLSESQYEQIGFKRAPNFTYDRHHVYQAFLHYRKLMKKKDWFDEMDVIFHIYKRMKSMKLIPWCIHTIYTDETQDFSQAELALLVSLCNNSNNMFLAGDTAQSIMKGISFRFADLKSLFYLEAEKKSKGNISSSDVEADKNSKGNSAVVNKPGQIYQLTHNYRSHAGILSMASAILDIIVELFPETIDCLQKDQGLFDGPKPVIIESCLPDELMKLLTGNKRDTSHIEFGAHQAILVVDSEAKEQLPEELRSAIALTIYESKGLEFDDVLLYNFFTCSKVDKEWRVVTDFLEKLVKHLQKTNQLENLQLIDEDVLLKDKRPRALEFDSRQHKLLDTELKQLYTAVTRARVNVWIFDEDPVKRAPMFEYFKALKLVQDMNEFNQNDQMKGFTKKSTPEEWKSKGEDYVKNKNYALAIDCFRKANEPLLEKIAKACLTQEEAKRLSHNVPLMKSQYAKAGAQFVFCEELEKAAHCFERSDNLDVAALCLKKCGKFELAAHLYKRISDTEVAANCFEQCGQFAQSIELLVAENKIEKAVKSLHTYQHLIQSYKDSNQSVPTVLEKYKPGEEFTENKLWLRLAEYEHGKALNCRETLNKVNDPEEKINFFKKKQLWEDAAKILYQEGDAEEAAQLMFRNGNLSTALEYAKGGFKKSLAASICVAMAQAEYKSNATESPKEILRQALRMYNELNDNSGQGVAKLFLGQYSNDLKLLMSASKHFSDCKLSAGQLECNTAIYNMTKMGRDDCNRMVSLIELGCKVIDLLCDRKLENVEARKQNLKFYGLELDTAAKKVTWYPHEYPLYMTWVNSQEIKFHITIPENEAIQNLCHVIAGRIIDWSRSVRRTMSYDSLLLCRRYRDGFRCDKSGCRFRHNFNSSPKEDTHIFNFWRISVILEVALQTVEEKTEKFSMPETKENVVHERNNWFGVRAGLESVSFEQIMFKLSDSKATFPQMERYIQSLLDTGRDQVKFKDKISTTKWVTEACFLSSLLKLENIDFRQYVTNLEVVLNTSTETWTKDIQMLAIYQIQSDQGEDNPVLLKTISSLFVESFSQLCDSHDLLESTKQFTFFLKELGNHKRRSLMPRFEHLLFWLEFHFSVTLFTMAHVNKSSTDKNRFYLPNFYFDNIKLVEACINKTSSAHNKTWKNLCQMVMDQSLSDYDVTDLQNCIVEFILGTKEESASSLLGYMEEMCGSNPLLAERILILSLVILINIPKELVSAAFEIPMRLGLYNIKYNESMPPRLTDLIQQIQNARLYTDLVKTVSFYLKSIGDKAMKQCTWLDRKTFFFKHNDLDLNRYPEMTFYMLPAAVPEDLTVNRGVENTQGADQQQVVL
ncbi:hypothetical protein Btru_042705 [Bulinus truncatus]|nr:hypothetical protein Btru_042705 [Bulinus truncatus]